MHERTGFIKVVKAQTPLNALIAQLSGRYAYDRYWTVAEDEHGVIGADGKIAHNQTERFVSTCELRIFEVDDHARISGWVPQERSGHFVLRSACASEQAPEAVRELWWRVARRVAYQIALSSDLDDDAALLARYLTGVNLLNPIERMSCIAEGNA